MTKIVVDGNDGTGKSHLVALLVALGYDVQDRGDPTKMTDNLSHVPSTDVFNIILDAPVETCRKRLAAAGRDLNEKYHTIEDLTYYRQRFIDVSRHLPNVVVIDASGSSDDVLKLALDAMKNVGVA